MCRRVDIETVPPPLGGVIPGGVANAVPWSAALTWAVSGPCAPALASLVEQRCSLCASHIYRVPLRGQHRQPTKTCLESSFRIRALVTVLWRVKHWQC